MRGGRGDLSKNCQKDTADGADLIFTCPAACASSTGAYSSYDQRNTRGRNRYDKSFLLRDYAFSRT